MTGYDPFRAYSAKAFYHFTDTRNLQSVRAHGGLLSLRELKNRGIVIPAAGGNDLSHEIDSSRGLDRFVHLCFRASHPMEFRAREYGRIRQSIFLEIDPEVRQLEGVLFTHDVSNKSGIIPRLLQESHDSIDFEVLYTNTDWRNAEIKKRLQAAGKCELLVPDFVPLKYIRNLPYG